MPTGAAKQSPKAAPRLRAAPHREQHLYQQMRALAAVFAAVAAYVPAVAIRTQLPWLHGQVNFATRGACLALCIALLASVGLFPRGAPPKSDIAVVARAGLTAEFLVFSSLFFARGLGVNVSRPILLLYGAFATFGIMAVYLIGDHWQGAQLRRAPIRLALVGHPERCRLLADKIAASPHWQVVDCIPDLGGRTMELVDERLRRAIRDLDLDAVVLSSSPAHESAAALHARVLSICEQTGTRLQLHADWLYRYSHFYLERIGTDQVLTYSFTPMPSWPLVCKRGLDVLIAASLLLLSLPVLAAAAVAIRLESSGPVIFKQVRCGRRGQPFRFFKLRTMVSDAETLKPALDRFNEMSGPVFKMRNDPRVTRVGRWLRRTSIDEIPQFVNVLRGEMSIVGPRPPLPAEVDHYTDSDLRRLCMRPGITGLWQVRGR